jgi:O-antigen/teichoic acid export membrane protein
MLLPDHVYRRIPKLLFVMGIFFLILGLLAGPDFEYFGAYIALGFVSIGRSIWVSIARRRVVRHSEVAVLTATQRIKRRR